MLPELLFLHLIILLILPVSCYPTSEEEKKLKTIHWNSSNPHFKSREYLDVDVYVGEFINIVCPHYTPDTPSTEWEYYVIYMVSKPEFDTCVVYDPVNVRLIANCSSPLDTRKVKTTLFFMEFQGMPGMPDFLAGKSYYFTTTSKGPKSGLSNQVEGACKENNMRLKINVHPASDNNKPDPTNPTIPTTQTSTKVTTNKIVTRKTTLPRSSVRTTTKLRPSSTTPPTTRSPRNEDPNYDTQDDLRENPAKDTIILADGPGNSGTINSSERQCAPQTLLILFCSILLAAHVIQR